MLFHVAKSRSETKLLFFETQSIKKDVTGLRIAVPCLPSLSSPWQRLICPALTRGVLKLNKQSSGKISKCLKAYESIR